ncbi:MAG: lysoplasmalogenase [Deltaproteobacteria bacterium]|nr:MAG: lysoplasmalogenase [Deltaproteobacteria bacterium]
MAGCEQEGIEHDVVLSLGDHAAPRGEPLRPNTLLLSILGSAAIAGFFYGLWTDWVELRIAIKHIPVLCMLAWVWLARPTRYGVWIAVGLGLSSLGDLLLELPIDLFVYGLIAFLLAHLAYIAAALDEWPPLRPLHALPFVAWCVGLYLWLLPSMDDLAVPVAVYVVVICTMLWRMAARADASALTTLALVGAISFAASDSLIAVRKFSSDFAGAREAIMILYWLGQLLLATSAVLAGRGSAPASTPDPTG